MGRPSSGRRVFGRGVGRAVLGGLDSLVRFALMDGRRGGQPTGNQLQDRGCELWPSWSMRQFSIAAFSSRRKGDGGPVLYALGRLPVRGLGPRLRRGGTWVRIFLTDDLRVRESLLVCLCSIKCLITTKPNFAIIIDRNVVMHHKI